MNPNPLLLGIDLGGTKTAVVLGTASGDVLKRVQFPTGGPGETVAKVAEAARGFGDKPSRVGIACGGPLDTRRGSLLAPPNLPLWHGAPLVAMFEKEFSAPVSLVNDANAGALAEWRWGAGRGKSDLIFLTCGTGMGAGIISDGRLIAGAMGNAGEIGHVRLSTEGPVGYGKEGSVEGWTSGGGLGRLAISKGWPAGTDAKAVVEAAQSGDEKATALLRHMGQRLGETLAILIDLMNPQCVALGSFYIRAQKFLEPAMGQVLARECLAESLGACAVVPAQLGERIGDCQALAAALEPTREGK